MRINITKGLSLNFDIIKHQIGNSEINSVSARVLHEQLQVKSRFNDWINNRIKKYGFVENEDFKAVTKNLVTAQGNTSTFFDYIVSIDMAKELAMVENSEIGRKIRRYFIEVEKKFREQSQKPFSRKEEVESQLVGLEFTFKHLRPSEASKIGMTKTLFGKIGLETSYLPEYSDEEHTFSAKALLEKFEIKISVQQFNKKMILAGFLETKTRKSSKYRTEKDVDGKEVKIPILKEFKSLTEKGLEFGKNMISPKNQLESQPHYFEKKFSQLLELLQI
jgi:phage anti-repressor protein/ribosomal protein L7/L12